MTAKQGHLAAARSAGASDDYITFIAEYPESELAESLKTAISLDALDRFKGFSSSFEWSLWNSGVSAASNADTRHAKMMRDLFDHDRLPEVVAEGSNE